MGGEDFAWNNGENRHHPGRGDSANGEIVRVAEVDVTRAVDDDAGNNATAAEAACIQLQLSVRRRTCAAHRARTACAAGARTAGSSTATAGGEQATNKRADKPGNGADRRELKSLRMQFTLPLSMRAENSSGPKQA